MTSTITMPHLTRNYEQARITQEVMRAIITHLLRWFTDLLKVHDSRQSADHAGMTAAPAHQHPEEELCG